MPGCSAINCSNRAEQGFKMKVFPKDPTIRAIWKAKVKRPDWSPTYCSYLCEVHFEADQWVVSASGKRKLKRDAIPTIFTESNEGRKEVVTKKIPKELPSLLKIRNTEEFLHIMDENMDKDKHIELLTQSLQRMRYMTSVLQLRNESLKRRVTTMSMKYSILKAKYSRTRRRLICLAKT